MKKKINSDVDFLFSDVEYAHANTNTYTQKHTHVHTHTHTHTLTHSHTLKTKQIKKEQVRGSNVCLEDPASNSGR